VSGGNVNKYITNNIEAGGIINNHRGPKAFPNKRTAWQINQ